MNNNKGITLIALVITIIVMLILVAVSVTVALQGGLFTTTEDAKQRTQNAVDRELALSNGDIIDQWVNGTASTGVTGGSTAAKRWNITEGASGTWTDNGNNTFTKGNVTVAIGDYVEYNEGTGYTYTPDTSEGAGTGYNAGLTTSSISTENLSWRVLGIDTSGNLELISENPTTAQLYLYGQDGWTNAETVLNEMCDELYGQGTGAIGARSLKVEDVNKLSNYTPEAVTYYKYGYDSANNCIRGTEASSASDTSLDGINGWNNVSSTIPFTTPLWTITSETDEAKVLPDDYYYYPIHDPTGLITGSHYHWLASRCVYATGDDFGFNVRDVNYGNVIYDNLYYSSGDSGIYFLAVRPVVSLESTVQLTKVE